ncbi:MAG: hypothetical protein KAX20_04870 [Candidatus Omnitrophica bacterium]|nr:hypothetical protein [Candidatus Omnitrophota bacterium]
MREEKEIRAQIKKITDSNQHILDQKAPDFQVNCVVFVMQVDTIAKLDALYFALGEKRPRYEYDNKVKEA